MPNEWGTAGLVPGLKTRLTSAELASHMKARAEYHGKRRDEKRAELPSLEELSARVKAMQPAQKVEQFNKSGPANYQFDGDDAVANLKRDITSHNDKSVAFAWFAEHLFPEDYCLDRADLVALEILK